MIYKVKIDNRIFEVEIPDLHARPVIAIIEGEEFEVWPQPDGMAEEPVKASLPTGAAPVKREVKPAPATMPEARNGSSKSVLAPIPGVIVSVAVQPGDEVTTGQPLCVIEAMKMKNTIRSPRDGHIATVSARPGEHVKHHDILLEFTD